MNALIKVVIDLIEVSNNQVKVVSELTVVVVDLNESILD